jgi:hypothetical protein
MDIEIQNIFFGFIVNLKELNKIKWTEINAIWQKYTIKQYRVLF